MKKITLVTLLLSLSAYGWLPLELIFRQHPQYSEWKQKFILGQPLPAHLYVEKLDYRVISQQEGNMPLGQKFRILAGDQERQLRKLAWESQQKLTAQGVLIVNVNRTTVLSDLTIDLDHYNEISVTKRGFSFVINFDRPISYDIRDYVNQIRGRGLLDCRSL